MISLDNTGEPQPSDPIIDLDNAPLEEASQLGILRRDLMTTGGLIVLSALAGGGVGAHLQRVEDAVVIGDTIDEFSTEVFERGEAQGASRMADAAQLATGMTLELNDPAVSCARALVLDGAIFATDKRKGNIRIPYPIVFGDPHRAGGLHGIIWGIATADARGRVVIAPRTVSKTEGTFYVPDRTSPQFRPIDLVVKYDGPREGRQGDRFRYLGKLVGYDEAGRLLPFIPATPVPVTA